MLMLLLLVSLLGQTLEYGSCPGDYRSYFSTGFPEEWLCGDRCISVDQRCHGKCREGRYSYDTFRPWGNQSCVRKAQWRHCNASSGVIGDKCRPGDEGCQGAIGDKCVPGDEGCQPLQVPCGGKCPGDAWYKNWWLCSSADQCILAAQVCSGHGPFCRDGSDQSLETCSANIATCLPVISYYTPSRSLQCKSGRKSQCVVAGNTGVDCMDRSDSEKVFNSEDDVKNNTANNDIAQKVKELEKCTTSGARPGIQCLNSCVVTTKWCNPFARVESVKCKLPGGNAQIDDVRFAGEVCQDRQFWKGHECGEDWTRCPGHTNSQCYFSKYNKCVIKVGWGTCQDKSHRVCEIAKTYESGFSGVKATGEQVCRRDKEEMFLCQDNSTCIHKKLLCDGTRQCSDGSDESPSSCSCPWKLDDLEGPDILNNRQISSAEVRCRDKRFPNTNITTCAVRCDGKEECLNKEDEKDCQEETTTFWTTVGCVIVFFVALSVLSVHHLAPRVQQKIIAGQSIAEIEMTAILPQSSYESTRSSTRLINLICGRDQELGEEERRSEMAILLNNLHQNLDFADHIQIVASTIQIHHRKAEVERRNQILHDLEMAQHQGSHEMCLKNNMGTNSVTQAVIKGQTKELKDKFLSFIGTYLLYCFEVEERFFRMGQSFNHNKCFRITMSLAEMCFYYVDLLKDLAVIFIMFRLTSTSDLNYSAYFCSFNGILLLLELWTVIASMLLTAVYLSASHPGDELQLVGVKRSGCLNLVRILTFFLALLVPTTLIYQLTRQKVTLHTIQEKLINTITTNQGHVEPEEVKELLVQKKKVIHLEFLTYFKQKNDLILEVIIQTTINIVMLLMVRAAMESLTETGIQAVFADSTFLLAVGFVMSIKKIVTSHLSLINADKSGFLPIRGKCLTTISYLLATLLRIGCVTLFFGMPLGVLNILVHKGALESYNHDTRQLVYDVQNVNGNLTILRIKDVYNITNMNYTELTGMPLRWYGIVFTIGVVIHILLVSAVKKLVFGKAFRQLPSMEKFLHILHTIAFPETSVDWDYGNTGTLEVYKQQWRYFKREKLFIILVHLLENLLMAVPVITISSNVIAYHERLPYTTDLEKEAYSNARTLRVVCPLAVLLTPILQGFLLWAYNKYGHPWKNILAKMDKVVEAEQMVKEQGEAVVEM